MGVPCNFASDRAQTKSFGAIVTRGFDATGIKDDCLRPSTLKILLSIICADQSFIEHALSTFRVEMGLKRAEAGLRHGVSPLGQLAINGSKATYFWTLSWFERPFAATRYIFMLALMWF